MKISSENTVPRIDTTNASTDDLGPAAYVALVSSSVHEMLYSPAGTGCADRETTYQLLPLIVIVSDPLILFSGTSFPFASCAEQGGPSTGIDE
ncbi:MAG: hypothetical protein HOV67_12435 [Kribbellaceae bacterium]|nr:hypothetical protein [Kribbellaceae bacterium]